MASVSSEANARCSWLTAPSHCTPCSARVGSQMKLRYFPEDNYYLGM